MDEPHRVCGQRHGALPGFLPGPAGSQHRAGPGVGRRLHLGGRGLSRRAAAHRVPGGRGPTPLGGADPVPEPGGRQPSRCPNGTRWARRTWASSSTIWTPFTPTSAPRARVSSARRRPVPTRCIQRPARAATCRTPTGTGWSSSKGGRRRPTRPRCDRRAICMDEQDDWDGIGWMRRVCQLFEHPIPSHQFDHVHPVYPCKFSPARPRTAKGFLKRGNVEWT